VVVDAVEPVVVVVNLVGKARQEVAGVLALVLGMEAVLVAVV
jgi:hypothetical protein